MNINFAPINHNTTARTPVSARKVSFKNSDKEQEKQKEIVNTILKSGLFVGSLAIIGFFYELFNDKLEKKYPKFEKFSNIIGIIALPFVIYTGYSFYKEDKAKKDKINHL